MTALQHAPLALALLVAGAAPGPAAACETLLRVWANRQITLRLVDDGVMTDDQRAVAQTAIAIADRNTSGLRMQRGSEVSRRLPANGRSEVAFVDDFSRWCDGDAAGCTHAWTFAGITYEADVLMDAAVDWDTTLRADEVADFGGQGLNLLAALVHELGHVMGLDHEPDELSVMSTFGRYQGYASANRGDYTVSVGADASECLHLLYGKRTGALPPDDLVALGFTWLGEEVTTDGEVYAVHRPTTVVDADGEDTSQGSSTSPGTPAFGTQEVRLRGGGTYDVEFTIENSGAATRDVKARLVLSTNASITTADPILWQGMVRVGAFQARTSTANVRIPWTFELGEEAYLGLLVDPDGAIAETRTVNNATVLRRVVGGWPEDPFASPTAVVWGPVRSPLLGP